MKRLGAAVKRPVSSRKYALAAQMGRSNQAVVDDNGVGPAGGRQDC